MSSIACLRPWMKPKEVKASDLPADNMNIYIMPSLLDVLGTIVDTSGLYYVPRSIISDERFGQPDAEGVGYLLHLYNYSLLP